MYEKASTVFDSIAYAATDYFEITRRVYDNKNVQEFKKIGIVRPIQTEKELNAIYTKEEISTFKKVFKLNSNNDLVKYFKQNKSPNAFSLGYFLLKTKLAMGHIFLDKDVKEGEVYEYRIERITINNSKEVWGSCIVNSKAKNKLLPFLKLKGQADNMSDSLVALSWHIPIKNGYIDSLIKNVTSTAAFTENNISKKYDFNFYGATVFVQSDNGWISSSKLLPTLNATQDTIKFIYTQKTVPDEIVVAYLKMEDEVGNLGVESDTAYAFAVSKQSVPLLMGIKVEDVVDAVKISWKPLPPKPYILGVQILRYNSKDELDTVGVIGLTDTVYYDYNIKVGQTYRYQATAFYIPQIKLKQEHPAQGIGQYTKFSIPQPPYELTATNEKKNIRLNWQYDDHPSFYAFYIYRGTSPKNMSLIAGPIKTKTFLDTAGSLSGRSEYSYTVVTQNLRQDTSIYSNVVSIKCDRKIETTFPKEVSFYYANGKLKLMWDDVRKMDNAIATFIVQKKKKNDKAFKFLTTETLVNNSIIDSAIEAGVTYQYKVACISFKGDTSEYSNASEFILQKSDVDIMDVFYVRNSKDAIEISVPPMILDERKLYNIYRREAKEKSFTKLGSMPATQFEYNDKTAKQNVVYVYAVTVTNNDGREGVRGKSISVRKD